MFTNSLTKSLSHQIKEQKNKLSPQEVEKEIQKAKEPSLSLSVEEKKDLVEKAEGCSTRATMKLLFEVDPSLSVSKEQTRFLYIKVVH